MKQVEVSFMVEVSQIVEVEDHVIQELDMLLEIASHCREMLEWKMDCKLGEYGNHVGDPVIDCSY